jgi:transposase
VGGLPPGKTDAQRIAAYAYRFADQLRVWQPPGQVVEPLALWSATPQRLILVYNQLAVPFTEQQSFITPTLQKQVQKRCKAS